MNNIKKILLSVMIALLFVLPTSAVIADKNGDADALTDIPAPNLPVREPEKDLVFERKDAVNAPLVEQTTSTEVMGAYLGETDSNAMFPLMPARQLIPLKDAYEVWYKLQSIEVPSVYEPEVEIYKYESDVEYCLYETSFEDNALNYMYWGQIDGDCNAQGGYYDGWSWSDARACGSDHAFKSTMYDEYKNMQDDMIFFKGYLNEGIDLTADIFDLCDGTTSEINPEYVKVEFDVYVDGEYKQYLDHDTGYFDIEPLDYFLGGLLDWDGNWVPITSDMVKDNWAVIDLNWVGNSDGTNIDGGNQILIWDTNGGLYDQNGPGDFDWTEPDNCEPNCPDQQGISAEKISGCPGWWHVTYHLNIDMLPDECAEHFRPAFRFISDKERVFEGAYVDNVKISVKQVEGNKVFQGHSQQWLTDESTDVHYWKFPLEWTNDIEETFICDNFNRDLDSSFYTMIIKIKADDASYEGPMPGYYVYYEVDFEIGQSLNLKVTSMEIEDDFYHNALIDGILEYPSDAHIKWCIENSNTRIGCDESGNPIDIILDSQEPAEEVTVKTTAYKLEKETLLFDDFEGMFGWSVFDQPHNYIFPPYVTTFDPWSGSKCLALNNPDNNLIYPCKPDGSASRQIVYSNKAIDMENVEECYLDFYYKVLLPAGSYCYWIFTGYTYILGGGYVGGNGATDQCLKTWTGPMQPQCNYMQIDFKDKFVGRQASGFFLDENGHQTYETNIGFYLFSYADSEHLVPAQCFEIDEVPFSGVWIDDVQVRAVTRADVVWQDSTIITGCEPGDICCDQFTWEDPDYCQYKVVVEVEGDCDMGYEMDMATCNSDTSDNWMTGTIMIIEDCEAWYKAENVDITECTPEAWCISNVVGNDCGNGGIGDHYALATNCDSAEMPSDVQDTIGFGCLDVSHAWNWAPGDDDDDDDDDDDFVEYCVAVVDDVAAEASGYFSSEYYDQRLFESFDLGGTYDITNFEFYAVIAWGDDNPEGLLFDIEFYADDGPSGEVGTSLYQEDWTCGASDYIYYDAAWGYTVWLISGTLSSPATVSNGWVSFYSIDPAMLEDLAWIDGQGQDGMCLIRNDGIWGTEPIDLAYCISTGVKADPKGYTYVSTVALDDGFESIPFDLNWATNTGWLDSLYGYAHGGSQWAYSWGAGDQLGSFPIMAGNSTDPAHPAFEVSFWHAVELGTHPMDLYIGIDGVPIYALYGVTDEDYVNYVIDFTPDVTPHGMHTVDFWGMTSDFYGQMLDDVVVTTWDEFFVEDPVEETTPMYFNMTYQSDIKGDSAVYLDWAWVPADLAGTCDGCEEQCACPSGINDWSTVEIPETNKECMTFSQPLMFCEGPGSDPLAVIPTNYSLCLRLRFANWDYDWGIGFHVHEMGLTDVYDITAPENAVNGYKDAMWDFEDTAHSYTDIKVPLIDEKGWCDPGMHRELGDITLTRDCVSFGDHGKLMGEGDPALAGGEFAIYETASWVVYGAGVYTLKGNDAWGDGWTDYTLWSWIDVFVDGSPVITDFTVTGSSNTATFAADEGQLVQLYYFSNQAYWAYENSFYLKDPNGATVFSYTDDYGADTYYEEAAPFVSPENVGREMLWPPEPIHESIVWETEIEDSFEAYLFCGYWDYNVPVGAAIYFELSADGGDHWYIIAKKDNTVVGASAPLVGVDESVHISNLFGVALFDLTPWAGQSLLIRLRVHNPGVDGVYGEGFVSIRDVHILCKQDNMPPSTTINLQGNMVSPGLYAGEVTVTINAVDNHGMGQIHYILDGTEKVVDGNKATFKVNTGGAHTIEYWGVDSSGNEGAHATVSFSIDLSPPTVAITAPEPGLYLFGNKLLGMSKPIIIGAFTAEATASDTQGVRVVQFMLNGEVVGEDTTTPYSAYIAVKNMGAATLKVVAVDGVGNTAEDTLDITYFKFL